MKLGIRLSTRKTRDFLLLRPQPDLLPYLVLAADMTHNAFWLRYFPYVFLAAFAQDVVRLLAMQEFIIVYVTAGSPAEGDRLARALVDERLAACVNRIAPVQSVYRWEGKLEQSEEQLLIIKTQKELFAALEKRVRELHSYSVPEIIALPIIDGSQDYLRWLAGETTGGTG